MTSVMGDATETMSISYYQGKSAVHSKATLQSSSSSLLLANRKGSPMAI